MRKVLANQEVSGEEISTLLDWFNKVRTGLWLGFLRLDQWQGTINPKFHIDSRIARKARLLFIYEKSTAHVKGLTFMGVNTPIFTHMPCCFALMVNNKVFFNESTDFF